MYCKCRMQAAKYNDKLNSREGAAELLGLSPSTLASYELNLTKVVPVESIALMADVYNAPELKNWYCSNICPLGEDMPKIEIADIDRITVRTLATFRKLAEIKDSLLDITADGVITEDEKPQLDKIILSLKELNEVAQTLIIWAEKNIKE